MKFIIFLLAICILVACGHRNAITGLSDKDSPIAIQNAYSDLFLDSNALAVFFRSQALSGSEINMIKEFYQNRSNEFAWFNKDGPTLQAEGFWHEYLRYVHLTKDTSFYDKDLDSTMLSLLNEDIDYRLSKDNLDATELLLTKCFFRYFQAAFALKVEPRKLNWYIPVRKQVLSVFLDSVFSKEGNGTKPLTPEYYKLREAIFRFREISNRGGWVILPIPTKSLKAGDTGYFIKSIKRRLSQAGLYVASDSTIAFSQQLNTSIIRTQVLFGLEPSGIIDAKLIKALNVPVSERIRQMLINLERMKWMPALPDPSIVVNIPEYRLRVISDKKEMLTMGVVVGKAARKTVIFSDEIKFVVFGPYWNVPRSIIRSEILPAMKRSKNYLRNKNMEITGYRGGLPVIRQKPGGRNALGRVKFLFPNEYNIYLHDSPQKTLFGRNKRAFSHGCVRVQHPFELAKYLIGNDEEWNDAMIKKAMNGKKEKWVSLKKGVPVFITYFTSWLSEDGQVNFRDDIYGHDKKLGKYLFSE